MYQVTEKELLAVLRAACACAHTNMNEAHLQKCLCPSHMWMSQDKLGCLSLLSTSFETGSLCRFCPRLAAPELLGSFFLPVISPEGVLGLQVSMLSIFNFSSD